MSFPNDRLGGPHWLVVGGVGSGPASKRLSDAHRTPTQLDRFAVFARHQLIVLKALDRLFRLQA